jgi:glycosyltransferase involved in cell wall biosynthesis
MGRMLLERSIRDPHALGYAADRVLNCAIQQKADLSICHLELALWVGTELQRRGSRVGVDIEDWYSEAGVGSNSLSRYLRALEQKILRGSVHATTTSNVMADAISTHYACRKPKVIYNSVPSHLGSAPSPKSGPLRLIWFSQRIGEDRGLQDVFLALPMFTGNWTLELRAKSSVQMRKWVESQLAPEVRSRVRLEPTVPPQELSCVVARCDIGFAPESPSCRNKALTISNKMFQYLQSGLLVAASDTPGQREVLGSFPRGGRLYPPGDSDALAGVVNQWLNNSESVRTSSSSISSLANTRFAYEHQATALLESVAESLDRKCLLHA